MQPKALCKGILAVKCDGLVKIPVLPAQKNRVMPSLVAEAGLLGVRNMRG
jgi:hypothetical protein